MVSPSSLSASSFFFVIAPASWVVIPADTHATLSSFAAIKPVLPSSTPLNIPFLVSDHVYVAPPWSERDGKSLTETSLWNILPAAKAAAHQPTDISVVK